MASKLVSSAYVSLCILQMVYGEPQVPCYFIFGDSLMDNGNNNALNTTAKANFPPYGIDFPDGPTGRFSNGQNIADVIAQLLGFKNYILPFATAKGAEILQGVNYASGAAGILDESGQHLGERISLNQQLLNHGVTISRLASILGSRRLAKEYVTKCIYTVGMGNNDYINNYFLPQFYQTSRLYTPERYAEILILQYSRQLKTLYKYGAKKVGIFPLGYSGCTPEELAIYGTKGSTSSCVDMINEAIILFNARLRSLIGQLNKNLDAKSIYIDAPSSYTGMTVDDKPCCQVSDTIGKGQCEPNGTPCSNRSTYVFWDGFHPTTTVSHIDGKNAYAALSPLYTLSNLLPGQNYGDTDITSM